MKRRREIVLVSCTRGSREGTELYDGMSRLAPFRIHYVENNAAGLPLVYNEYLDRYETTDVILVLVHDDVTIADPLLAEKLSAGAESFVVQGLAGASSFDVAQRAWVEAPRRYLSGAVEHALPDGISSCWGVYGPTPRRCVVLDGLFLAIDMMAIGPVRFDEAFDFHFYDLDFCLSAHRAKKPLGTVNVYARHASRGNFAGDAFERALTNFRRKWATTTAGTG